MTIQNKENLVRLLLALVVSMVGLALTGILYLWSWMLIVLYSVKIFTEYAIVPEPYMPALLLCALAVPFILFNWWWSGMVCDIFDVPVVGTKNWLMGAEK